MARKQFQCKHCEYVGYSGGEMSGHSRREHPGAGKKAKAKAKAIPSVEIGIEYLSVLWCKV